MKVFLDYFLKDLDNIDDDLILFNKLSVPVHYQGQLNFDFYYLLMNDKHRSSNFSRFDNLDIIGQYNNGECSTLATFYKSSPFSSAIKELLCNKKYIDNLFLYLKFEGKASDLTLSLVIYTYMKQDYLDNILNGTFKSINKYLFNIIKFKFKKAYIKDLNIVEELNIESQIDYSTKIKLYNYQNLNVTWMKKNEEGKEINLYYPKVSYNVYCIESINKMLVLDYNGNIIQKEHCNKLNYKFNGGVLCDDVGLGKSISIITLIKNNSKGTTLIICPTRLCIQWGEEINKSSDLTFKQILNITQYKKFRKDTKKYDIVILPYNFFINKNYLAMVENDLSDNLLIHNINWERVVLDEGHEYITSYSTKSKKLIKSYIKKLKSEYKWICSATPLKSYISLNNIINFISDKNNFDTYKHYHDFEYILKSVFRRNTKVSVKEEIVIPEPIIETHLLNFTALERNIYDSAVSEEEQQKFCNHILVDSSIESFGSEAETISDIHKKMTKYYKQKIQKINNRLEQISQYDYEFSIISKELTIYKQKLNVFNSLDEEIEKNNTCPICLDDFDNLVRVITPCGHMFCSSCLKSMGTKSDNKCAICRTKYNIKNLNIVKNNEDQNKLGAKITYLLMLLENIKNKNSTKIIIFSKYDGMLKLLKKVFDGKDIKSLFISGSVYVMNSKLKKFKNSDISIILMSSDKYPSGLNLVEATNIILLDTMYNSKSKTQIVETQAIGRAFRIGQNKQIKVDRIIIRDTIEHKNYRKFTGIKE